jgi:hypothetical protein
MSDYRNDLIRRFWDYRRASFAGADDLFDDKYSEGNSPPVFKKEHASENVLVKPSASEDEKKKVRQEIPPKGRHRWFRSMTSSQALAQSVFGNLKFYGKLGLLGDIRDDEGQPIFANGQASNFKCTLEYDVGYLGEPRSTNVDAFLDGDYRVAVECKLSEADVGNCSRPRLSTKDDNYERDHCDGSYTRQRGRSDRCSLTAIGVEYWKHVPDLLCWPADEDHVPCPLKDTYQIVRNVLAACVRGDRKLSPERGHAVLLYDERNPAFREGGAGWNAYGAVKESLANDNVLRRCTWQDITALLRADVELSWLAGDLSSKYGL